MKLLARACSTILLIVFPAFFVSAQSVSELTLAQVLEVTLVRAGPVGAVSGSQYQSSSWLAGLPSISASYLGSEEKYGTDEAELSLNLPIKSTRRRESDTKLQGLEAQLAEVGDLQRSLYFSGLIREALWSYQGAHINGLFVGRKLSFLLELEQRYKDLLQANATSEYALLLIQKELVVTQIQQQEYQQEARRWLLQYRHVTGLGTMPAQIEEPPLDSVEFAVASHPLLRQLDLAWSQQQQLLLAGSDRASPWKLSVNAKNLDVAGYDEDQYGIALEIPLSFIKMDSQANNSEWREGNRSYTIARDKMTASLHQRWQTLTSQRKSLQHKQQLLQRSSQLSAQISEQVSGLQAGNEISQEIALRRMMEASDTAAAAALNEVLIHRNTTMLRQTAGLTL